MWEANTEYYNGVAVQVDILPVGDLFEHTYGIECNCRPHKKVEHGRPLIKHNSYDHREYFEPDIN